MPTLKQRFAATHNTYPEPIRDRNKRWRFEKYRSVWSPRDPQFKKKRKRSKQPLRDSNVIEVGGETTNMDKLWQRIVCIRDEHAICSVFGVGVRGRLFGRGLRTSRFLLVDLYLPKRCSKHVLKVRGQRVACVCVNNRLTRNRAWLCAPGYYG